MKTRGGLYTELEEVIEMMQGISPKLSTYKQLEERKKQLKEALGGLSTSTGKPEGKSRGKFTHKFQHVHG